jgi:hypothetical protein
MRWWIHQERSLYSTVATRAAREWADIDNDENPGAESAIFWRVQSQEDKDSQEDWFPEGVWADIDNDENPGAESIIFWRFDVFSRKKTKTPRRTGFRKQESRTGSETQKIALAQTRRHWWLVCSCGLMYTLLFHSSDLWSGQESEGGFGSGKNGALVPALAHLRIPWTHPRYLATSCHGMCHRTE